MLPWLLLFSPAAPAGDVFPSVHSDQMQAVEEAAAATSDSAGSERAPEEHCSVPLTRDPECSDAIAALLDVKAFLGRQIGGLEGPSYLNHVPARRDVWLLGTGPPGSPSARSGSALDLGLFLEKKCAAV